MNDRYVISHAPNPKTRHIPAPPATERNACPFCGAERPGRSPVCPACGVAGYVGGEPPRYRKWDRPPGEQPLLDPAFDDPEEMEPFTVNHDDQEEDHEADPLET